MSGVVYLPPRPKKQRIRSALARVRTALDLRSVLIHQVARGRASATESPSADRGLLGLRPIDADSVSSVPLRPSRGALGLRSHRVSERRIVELYGELSLRTRDPLAEALEDALEDDAEKVVLDLSDLESIDGAGLHTILLAHQRAGDELKLLVIIPGPPAVQRVLEAAGAPFFYTARRDSPAGAAARLRGRRTRPSRRSGARTTGPRSPRRTR